jgi:hypothetical protein
MFNRRDKNAFNMLNRRTDPYCSRCTALRIGPKDHAHWRTQRLVLSGECEATRRLINAEDGNHVTALIAGVEKAATRRQRDVIRDNRPVSAIRQDGAAYR